MVLLKFIYILKLFENLFNEKSILNLLSTFLIFISFQNLTSNIYVLVIEVCIFLLKLGSIYYDKYKDVLSLVDITIQVIQILVQNEFKCVDE